VHQRGVEGTLTRGGGGGGGKPHIPLAARALYPPCEEVVGVKI